MQKLPRIVRLFGYCVNNWHAFLLIWKHFRNRLITVEGTGGQLDSCDIEIEFYKENKVNDRGIKPIAN